MKQRFHLLIVLLLFSCFFSSFSQSKTEIGLFGGGNWLQGDVNADRPYMDISYAIGALYKYDFTHRYVFRAQINYLNLQAFDAHSSDAYRLARNASFHKGIADLSMQFEFNFLQFKFSERYSSHSTYIAAGAGAYLAGGAPGLTLPMTVGFKQTLGRRWCIGIEYQLRKTFNDRLDGIRNPVVPSSMFNNNDWYAMAGITLTYKIFDAITDCPAYEKEKKKRK